VTCVCQGGVEDGSLAVDLLLEERIMGDALSADRVEYNSVTKALLEKGLALPKRRSVIRIVTIKNVKQIR